MLTCNLDDTKFKGVKRDGTMTPAERVAVEFKNKKKPNAQRSRSKWNQRHCVEFLALQAAVLSTNDGIEVRLLVQCHPKACSRRTGRSLTYQDIRAGKLPSPNADDISTKRHHWCSRSSMSCCRTQTRVERRKCSLVVDHCRLRIVFTAHNVGWVF